MLFRRREPFGWRERLRLSLWPRRSFWRSAKYYVKRALRLSATPHAIAAGVATGAFVSFLPIPGLHFILALVAAWFISANLVATALGTAVLGNPMTMPLLWAASFEVGRFLMNGKQPHHPMEIGHALRHLEFSHLWKPVLEPMLLGALVLGLASATIVYLIMRWATAAFQEQRKARLAEKADRRGRPEHGVPDIAHS
jgi:uncharacterized protein (DUF2062 family)